jgi:hypothetical protein
MRLRSGLYGLARVLGDISAIRRGRIGKRLVNKWLGRSLVRRLWR